MPISLGHFQPLNHGHAQKELDDYLDFRRLLASIKRHDPKGLVTMDFHKFGLVTQYFHEVYPDDSFIEDADTFETMLECMRECHLPEERIASLSQDPELERLE